MKILDIPAEFARDIAKRTRDAAAMGDVMTLNAIADEIKDQSDSCMMGFGYNSNLLKKPTFLPLKYFACPHRFDIGHECHTYRQTK
jgi:hypothetical protein